MSVSQGVVGDGGRLRLDHVDGMRALAALVVYLNHAYAQITLGDQALLQGPLSFARVSMIAGHLSVTVFIVLSGFCLTLPIVDNGGELRGGVWPFIKRRARRILPPYYAAVALCLLLIATIIGEPTGSLWDFATGVTPLAIGSHLLLLQDLVATSRINYVFWSIAVEWQIYFLLPVLVWVWRSYGLVSMVVSALAVGYALRIGLADTRITRMHPQLLGMFALGMVAAQVARSIDARTIKYRDQVPWLALAGLAFAVSLTASLLWGMRGAKEHFYVLDFPVGVMAACLLVASSKPRPTTLTRLLSVRPLVAVGTFSYSLYLIHAPLLQVIWLYVLLPLGVSRELMFVGLMTGGLALVLLASYFFFLAFEAPFLRRAARDRNATAPVVAGASPRA